MALQPPDRPNPVREGRWRGSVDADARTMRERGDAREKSMTARHRGRNLRIHHQRAGGRDALTNVAVPCRHQPNDDEERGTRLMRRVRVGRPP